MEGSDSILQLSSEVKVARPCVTVNIDDLPRRSWAVEQLYHESIEHPLSSRHFPGLEASKNTVVRGHCYLVVMS